MIARNQKTQMRAYLLVKSYFVAINEKVALRPEKKTKKSCSAKTIPERGFFSLTSTFESMQRFWKAKKPRMN